MTIRDINQYIEHLCGKNTIKDLGSNKELLLQKIYGQDPSPDQVKAVITDAASFANNAEEQLFYEFVQNAYDAGADSLFFYANEHYLIVLNNGEPFYTDFDIFESEEIRDGQLYNFLAKGKSLKRNDDHKLGKYGQGSKLLYTLLTKVSENEENEKLLIDAIYEKKKGPYLISWNDRRQLSNLLLKQPNWTPAQGDDYKENILFAKILMSYYPIAPGIDETLFSTDEALAAIEAFDTLVDPRRNLHYLDKGTALIIPLGEGQHHRIASEENLKKVRTRLSGFASITKNQEWNLGKNVDHIVVMGEEVEQYEAKSVFVIFSIEGNKFSYHFAFNPIFAEKNFVNFFKGLPIVETKYRLGFIIDSQKFEVDNSRQRINDTHKTESQLIKAFTELIAQLKELQKSDSNTFDYIYKAIAATRIPDGDDYKFIRNAFREVFKPFFEQNVLTSTGIYENRDNVRAFVDAPKFPLEEIGITKYKWIEENIQPDLRRQGIEVSQVDFTNILADANEEKLQDWISRLSPKDYEDFQNIADGNKYKSDVCKYKLFRTNKGKLYSFEELQSNQNVYYPIEEKMPFGECEHIISPLSDIERSSYINNLFQKIKTNIIEFRKSDSTKDDAANLLAWIVAKDASYAYRLKPEISLLSNRHDEYCPFGEIFEERPDNTILFDNYVVKGHIPNAILEKHWLLSSTNHTLNCWNWLVNHWQELQDKEEWGENTHKYIADVKAIYKNVTITGLGKLKLNLLENGLPTKDLRTLVNNSSRLSKEEYNYLANKIQNTQLQPFEYLKDLNEEPFQNEHILSLQIVGDGIIVDEEFLRIFIKITDDYLYLFHTQETDGKYQITKKSHGFNYVDSVTQDLQAELHVANFYHIPAYVQELLPEECNRLKFETNANMLINAIRGIENPIKLLPFVKRSNAEVVTAYFDHLQTIAIDTKISNDDLKWQVIEFAAQRSSEENNYIEIVFDQIRHSGYRLPSSIIQESVTIGNNQYCVP